MVTYLKPFIFVSTILFVSYNSYAHTPSIQDLSIKDNSFRLNLASLPQSTRNNHNRYFGTAQDQEIDCMTAAITQQNMNQCTQRKAQYSTQRLNQLMTEIQDLFGNTNKQGLQFEQLNQKWGQLREQVCLWEKTFFGVGLVAPMIYHNCITFYNTQYIEILTNMLCTTDGMQLYCNITDSN